jgi:hypothetical protein
VKKSDIASLDLDNSDDDALRDEIEPEDDNSDEDEINDESELEKYLLLKKKFENRHVNFQEERDFDVLIAQNAKLEKENLELTKILKIRTKKYLFTINYIRTLVKATNSKRSKGKLTELAGVVALFLLLKYETRTKYGIPKFYTTEELKSNIKEFMGLENAPTGISAALTNLKKLGFISKESKAASESRTKFKGKKGYRLILKSYKNYIKEYLGS